MIGARMLYLIEKESEMSCGFGTDVAYCIAGTEIRIPTPNGMKIFTLKQDKLPQPQPEKNTAVDEIKQQLTNLQKRISRLQGGKTPKVVF